MVLERLRRGIIGLSSGEERLRRGECERVCWRRKRALASTSSDVGRAPVWVSALEREEGSAADAFLAKSRVMGSSIANWRREQWRKRTRDIVREGERNVLLEADKNREHS